MPTTFNGFIATIKLSEVKHALLKALWDSSSSFPREWVTSSALLKLSQQKYFDRRLRELRDSEGLDLETKHINGEHCWRLASDKIGKQINRTYLTEAQKTKLFSSANNKCAICGKQTKAGVRGLQADHKIPLTRGGREDLSNWQPICNECNVAKRRMCQACELACINCSWAFPENAGRKILLTIPKTISLSPKISKLSDEDLTDALLKVLNDKTKQE